MVSIKYLPIWKVLAFLGDIEISSKHLIIKCSLISEGILTLAFVHSQKNVQNHNFSLLNQNWGITKIEVSNFAHFFEYGTKVKIPSEKADLFSL